MLKLLESLCELSGVSGREAAVADFILKEVSSFADSKRDQNGNIICFKKGKNSGKKIMIDAHMDEIGIIATYITTDGFVKFSCVGGISPAVLSGRRVVFENGVIGVISSKPVHLASADEKKKYSDAEKLYIDIGANSKENAEKVISIGDTAVMVGEFKVQGNTVISRALDDRVGVAVLIKLLKEDSDYDFYATFTVQEEVGCRGAKTAAFTVDPEGAIALECTTAADLHGVEEESAVCKLGGGPAVSFMDRSTLYDKKLYETALNGPIKCQPKAAALGGNNSGAIHLTRGGIPTIAISVPSRYIHSASSVCNTEDIENMYFLTKFMLSKRASGEVL